MSETRRSLTYDLYVRCDARGCQCQQVLRVFPAEPVVQRREEEEFLLDLAALGWTTWAGNRGRRNYCPDHGPSPKSRMWNATPTREARR